MRYVLRFFSLIFLALVVMMVDYFFRILFEKVSCCLIESV